MKKTSISNWTNLHAKHLQEEFSLGILNFTKIIKKFN
jgi:hypothetical protein